MIMKPSWKEKWDDFVFALGERGYTCDFCGREAFSYPTPRVCDECEAKQTKNDKNTCDKCGCMTVTAGVCMRCKTALPAFERGASPLVYFDETARQINRFKRGAKYLARYFALKALPVLQALTKDCEEYLLVPVPLTKERQRERGYNQAEELAKLLSRYTGAPCASEMLVKTKDGAQQKTLSAQERQKAIVGSYRVHERKRCEGKTLVLVDDVMTTATTGSECARVLYNAGAKRVLFLAIASVPERAR